MELFTLITSTISIANIALLVTLMLVYAKLYKATRAIYTLGLLLFASNKKKIAILSIFGNNDSNNDAIHVNELLELMDKLTSNIIVMDINYDDYEDIIAGDRSGNLYIFTSQVKYKNQEII